MILGHKKDGRRKGRLILKGYNEQRDLDGGPIDSPVTALATVRTMLFMCGHVSDVVSSIDVSTAFLQAEEYSAHEAPRFVSYKPHSQAHTQYWRLRGALYGPRSASMRWHQTLAKWLTEEKRAGVYTRAKRPMYNIIHTP